MWHSYLFRIANGRASSTICQRGSFAAVTVLMLVASGCADTGPVDPRIASLRPSALIVCPPENPDCNDRGPGGGINPRDSYVTGDVSIHSSTTVTLSAPVYDEATGQMTTSFTAASPDEHLHVDAGYSTSRATIVNTAFTDPVNPNTSPSIQVTQADLNADNLTEFNSANQQMQDIHASDVSAASPMNIVGSTQNADVTAGAIVDLTDTTSVQPSAMTSGVVPSAPSAAALRRPLATAAVLAERGQPQEIEFNGARVRIELTPQSMLRVTDLGLAGATPAAIARGAAESGKIVHSRLYKRATQDKWLLHEVRTEVDEQSALRRVHQEHVETFKNLRVVRNVKEDDARRVARPTTEWVPLPAPNGNIVRPFLVVCGDECNGGGPSSYGPPALGVDPGCARDLVAHVNTTGASMSLLYQHGIFSDATTWCSMDPYLRSRFVVGNEIRHTLVSTDYYENQAVDLESRVRSDIGNGYPGPYVLLGHSNGGIVSRLAAQTLVYNGSTVQGVVTVSSPQAGVPLARVGKTALTAAIAIPIISSKLACGIVSHLVCVAMKDLTGTSSVNSLVQLLDPILGAGRVLGEMTPNNGSMRL